MQNPKGDAEPRQGVHAQGEGRGRAGHRRRPLRGHGELLDDRHQRGPGAADGHGRAGPAAGAGLRAQLPQGPAGHAVHAVLQRPRLGLRSSARTSAGSATSPTRSRCWSRPSRARRSSRRATSTTRCSTTRRSTTAMDKAATIPAGPERNKAWAEINRSDRRATRPAIPYSWDDSFQLRVQGRPGRDERLHDRLGLRLLVDQVGGPDCPAPPCAYGGAGRSRQGDRASAPSSRSVDDVRGRGRRPARRGRSAPRGRWRARPARRRPPARRSAARALISGSGQLSPRASRMRSIRWMHDRGHPRVGRARARLDRPLAARVGRRRRAGGARAGHLRRARRAARRRPARRARAPGGGAARRRRRPRGVRAHAGRAARHRRRARAGPDLGVRGRASRRPAPTARSSRRAWTA